jgi:hypothetical protein
MVNEWQVEPVTDWEASLSKIFDRLLRLRAAAERYNELVNLMTGLMMTAEVSEIEIPGQGKATLRDGNLDVTVEPTAALKPFL